MTVVVPYDEFLARRERRQRIASELVQQDGRPTIDVEAISVTTPDEPPDESGGDGLRRAQRVDPARW